MQSLQNIHKNFRLQKGLKLPYKTHEGRDLPYWARFFIDPSHRCGTVESAESTLKEEDLIDSIWNRFVGKCCFYNTFLCHDGIAHYLYNRRKRLLQETLIAFNDEDFTKKLPKKPYDSYCIALARFLERAKKRLQEGKTIRLYFDGYEITMSKYRFVVQKEGQTVVENFIADVVYNDMDEVVINPHTTLSIHIYAPRSLYDFFLFYLGIRDKKLAESEIEVPKKGGFFVDMGHSLIYMVILFGLIILFWSLDARLSSDISPGRMAFEGFVALVAAEVIYGILKNRAM